MLQFFMGIKFQEATYLCVFAGFSTKFPMNEGREENIRSLHLVTTIS